MQWISLKLKIVALKKMARQPIEKKKILSSSYLKKNLFPEYI